MSLIYHRDQGGADALVEGFYLLEMRKAGRMPLPVWIRYGPPADPLTGEEMDRSHRWLIDIAGFPFTGEPLTFAGITFNEIGDIWPRAGATPIPESEYRFRLARQQWSARHDHFDPFATPGGKIDPMTATLPFLEN